MFNMNYASDTLENVREVLWNIKERGGLVSKQFIMAEGTRLQGQRAEATLNIALVAIGKPVAYPDVMTQAQLDSLVARAKRQNGDLISEIAILRAAKGK
jgi:hypothetical protein